MKVKEKITILTGLQFLQDYNSYTLIIYNIL